MRPNNIITTSATSAKHKPFTPFSIAMPGGLIISVSSTKTAKCRITKTTQGQISANSNGLTPITGAPSTSEVTNYPLMDVVIVKLPKEAS